eukprot:54842-Pelagomonas_calceolata.AAC.1
MAIEFADFVQCWQRWTQRYWHPQSLSAWVAQSSGRPIPAQQGSSCAWQQQQQPMHLRRHHHASGFDLATGYSQPRSSPPTPSAPSILGSEKEVGEEGTGGLGRWSGGDCFPGKAVLIMVNWPSHAIHTSRKFRVGS